MKTKRIIILDDHTLYLRGITLILKDYYKDCEIYPYQSIKKLKEDKLDFNRFNLIISDIEMANENTFDLFAVLKKKYPSLPILVISMHKKNAIIKKCKALNINGYILKDEDEQLQTAIDTILDGRTYFSKAIVEYCKQGNKNYIKLSNREEDILILIANGYNNNDISDKLFISIETIKTHKKNIKLKLNVESLSEITDYAKRNYLL
jgi:DNA-binding NarL/FixJ family response regulator